MPRKTEQLDGETAATVSLFPTNLFGPQSHWSSLLGEREHLQSEIKRGRKYLEQLRKDLAQCSAVLHGWPNGEKESEETPPRNLSQEIAANDAMEQFLLSWLERLEERRAAVMREIEDLQMQSSAEPLNPEEAMYELLRAAG